MTFDTQRALIEADYFTELGAQLWKSLRRD